MASRLGPAKPRGITWNGAGACVILSQSRQENFSRTVCITSHWRGTTSSVSVTSSPSFDSFVEPQPGSSAAPGSRRARAADDRRTVCGPLALERLYGLGPRRRLLGRQLVLRRRRLQLFERQLPSAPRAAPCVPSACRKAGAAVS